MARAAQHRNPLMDNALGVELCRAYDGATGDSDSRRRAAIQALKARYEGARAEAKRRLEGGEADGLETAAHLSAVMDEVIAGLFAVATQRFFPVDNPTDAQHLAVVPVGGYGRGLLAPGSDIDLLFLLPYKQTPWGESVVESTLYGLWDLGLKVGHASRTVDQCIRLAKADMTIRTSVLEARFLAGAEPLYRQLRQRFARDIVGQGSPEDFIEAKLAERETRHQRAGESRYLVEPNIKDGKGGLRDLHSLYWIAKYVYRVEDPGELVKAGLFTQDEFKQFNQAERFQWTVRCHLHFLTGRAEERLSFDVQPELARRLGYTDQGGLSAVEHFMKHYFLIAKDVGDLTRILVAQLELQNKKKRPSFGRFVAGLGRRREIGAFIAEGGRLDISSPQAFEEDPVNLIRLFHVAEKHELDIHPNALKVMRRSLHLIDDKLRADRAANALFLEILSSKRDPERALRLMNEAGVLGRFIPDFGRIVALMQFNMYHHYTVDEHLIRAVGCMAAIERGELASDHPLSSALFAQIKNRRALYVAILLHDIAKGRKRDHSEVGGEIAADLGPRLGLSPSETEILIWLVTNHLVMSDVAQRRDIADPRTVRDFAQIVQSPERLRLLLILTVADIRAVGPGVFNAWKGQLLRELYYETEPVLQGGHSGVTRIERVEQAQAALAERLKDLPRETVAELLARHYPPYWLSLDTAVHEKHARMMVKADREGSALTMLSEVGRSGAATEVTVYTPDHPGLFSRLAGAIASCGATIVDAKIFTTVHGMALDVFSILDAENGAFDDPGRIKRLEATIAGTLDGTLRIQENGAAKRATRRTQAFMVEPSVVIDNNASDSYTVIEVNGRDRPGLLHDLTRALFELSLSIASARIATYGERVVDVFYVKDGFGLKIANEAKLKQIEAQLIKVLSVGLPKRPAPAEPAPDKDE
jgi:[protein-PII] uridylyltransferase